MTAFKRRAINTLSLQDFHDFYAAIPEENWCTQTYTCHNPLRHCARGALGDCGDTGPGWRRVVRLCALLGIQDFELSQINDGTLNKYSLTEKNNYQQPTPKTRILALIQDNK